ncbi:hypothetical protein ACFQPG_03110 [Sphingomonas sp. GCM10030256]|uniref:hypothetical protein n=1 Tax=Sphingomonas sp. GCM10030256 TaxID=3273427 RepID=UPI003615E2AC
MRPDEFTTLVLAAAVLVWVGVRAAGGALLPAPLAAIPVPSPQTPLLDTQVALDGGATAQPALQPSQVYPVPAGYPAGYPAAYGAMPALRPHMVPIPVYDPAYAPPPQDRFAPRAAPMSYAPALEPDSYGGDMPRQALLGDDLPAFPKPRPGKALPALPASRRPRCRPALIGCR